MPVARRTGGRRGARCHTARMRAGSNAAVARLLGEATTASGNRPLPWAAAPLHEAARVLDLVCGAGPLAAEIGAGRWLGLDPTAAAPAPGLVVRATPTAIPLRDNAVDGVMMLLALPLMPDLDAVFAEVRRVLRPFGTLVAVVPSASTRSVTELRLARLLAPVRRGRWPNRSALDHLGWILVSADFAVLSDDRVPFYLPLPDADAAHRLVDELPAAGLWPPGLDADARRRLASELARRAGPDRVLPLALRRFVARR
jgi:SAM-dependent methyltransferase